MIKATNEWRKSNPRMAWIVGLFTLIATAGAAAKVIDDNRWWVWLSEWTQRNEKVDKRLAERERYVDQQFGQVRADILSVSTEQLRTRQAVLRGQLWQVEKEIRELTRTGKTVPESLYRERSRLRDAIENLRTTIRGRTARPPH